MTKDELINNLKNHQKQTVVSAWKYGISAIIVIVSIFLLKWKNPLEDYLEFDTVALILCLLYIVPFFIISVRNEKITDKVNKMYCNNCNQRFDQGTITAIAVLENKCQKCGAKIYEA